MKNKNTMERIIEGRLKEKEANSFKKNLIKYQVRSLGFSSEKAETTADRVLKAINQAAEEFKEISKEVKQLGFASRK